MYTLWIDDDGTVTTTVKETIMQRSSNVDNIQVLVNRYYKDDIDMSDTTVYMKYTTKSGETENLEMLEMTVNNLDYYEDGTNIMQYIISADTSLTANSGNLIVSFTFLKVVANEDNTVTTYVRKTKDGSIYITPVVNFENYIPDDLLNELDQRLIVMATQIADLNALNQELVDMVNALNSSADNDSTSDESDDTNDSNEVDIDELLSE